MKFTLIRLHTYQVSRVNVTRSYLRDPFHGKKETLLTQKFTLYALIHINQPLQYCYVIKGDHSRVSHRRNTNLPTPTAYVRALREGVSPSVLERRNREQRTAREFLIRHYQHPPPSRDQHSVFTRRIRGHRVRSKRAYRVGATRRQHLHLSPLEIR